VEDTIGALVVSDDFALGVDLKGFCEDRIGKIDRGEISPTEQEAVNPGVGASVISYNVSNGVDAQGLGTNGSREINRSKSSVAQQIAWNTPGEVE